MIVSYIPISSLTDAQRERLKLFAFNIKPDRGYVVFEGKVISTNELKQFMTINEERQVLLG